MPWNVYFMYNMDSYTPILVIDGVITPTNGILNGELSFLFPAILSGDITGPWVFLGDSRNLHGLELGWVFHPSMGPKRLVRSLSSTLQSPTGSLGSEAWQRDTWPHPGGEISHGKTWGHRGCFLIKWWVNPKQPPKWSFLVGKSQWLLGKPIHFRKPPSCGWVKCYEPFGQIDWVLWQNPEISWLMEWFSCPLHNSGRMSFSMYGN